MKRFIIVLLVLLIASCSSKKTRDLANQVYETETESKIASDKRIKEITRELKKIEDDLDKTLELYQKSGNFHRAMGIKMIHYKMFLKAYEHFDKAIEFYPKSEMLHYYKGLSAAQYAKSHEMDVVVRDYINRAKRSYEISLEINPRFPKGLYALSILYVYELDRANDAKPLLDRLLEISSREFDAMLLRALLHEDDGEYGRAIELYDKVLSLSKKESHKVGATENRERVLRKYTSD